MQNLRPTEKVPFTVAIMRKLAASRFLTTSLVIHLGLVILLGSVVMFKVAQQKQDFVAVGSDGILSEATEEAAPEPETPSEFEEQSATSSSAAPATSASAIQTLSNTASFNIAAAPSDQQVFGNTIGLSDRAISSVAGSGTKGGPSGGKMSGSLFGVKIDTKKLGVMVDVSGSAHGFLLGAFQEIDKSFKGMPTVLVFGCGGKKEVRSGNINMKPTATSERELEKNEKIGETVYGQVANALKKGGDLERYLKKLMNRKDVYWAVTDKDINPRYGAHQVMEFLISQDVDTIYWFSDLDDAFDVELGEDIGKKLKNKGVRVISHNFSGDEKKKGVPAAQKIVELTGGQLINKKIETK